MNILAGFIILVSCCRIVIPIPSIPEIQRLEQRQKALRDLAAQMNAAVEEIANPVQNRRNGGNNAPPQKGNLRFSEPNERQIKALKRLADEMNRQFDRTWR